MAIGCLPQSVSNFLRQGHSLNLELTDVAKPAVQKAPASSCLCLHGAGITEMHDHIWLIMYELGIQNQVLRHWAV